MYQQRESELLQEIEDLKQQLKEAEAKEQKPRQKGKFTSEEYAQKAAAANNKLGKEKESIIDKIKT